MAGNSPRDQSAIEEEDRIDGLLRSVDLLVYQLVEKIRSEEINLRVKNPDIVLLEGGHFNRNEM